MYVYAISLSPPPRKNDQKEKPWLPGIVCKGKSLFVKDPDISTCLFTFITEKKNVSELLLKLTTTYRQIESHISQYEDVNRGEVISANLHSGQVKLYFYVVFTNFPLIQTIFYVVIIQVASSTYC